MNPSPTARRSWPLVAGAIGGVAVVALVSMLVLDDDGERGEVRQRRVELGGPAALERQAAQARAEMAMREAQQAVAAAQAMADREAETRREAEVAAQADRALAIEAARTQGVLGAAALSQGDVFASITGSGDLTGGLGDGEIQGGLIGSTDAEEAFGFGRSGDGSGGGGTGLGTLGTYGTLGHGGGGTGTGYGTGSGRARATTAPQVRIGNAQVTGELDKNIVRRYIRRSLPRITYCYEKQLLAEPTLAGTVTATFEIGPGGDVTASEASGMDDEVARCVAATIRGIEFPRPKAGTVSVAYPFAMRPAGG